MSTARYLQDGPKGSQSRLTIFHNEMCDSDYPTPVRAIAVMSLYRWMNADATGAYPKLPRMAKDTGLNEKSIKNHLPTLILDGRVGWTLEPYRGSDKEGIYWHAHLIGDPPCVRCDGSSLATLSKSFAGFVECRSVRVLTKIERNLALTESNSRKVERDSTEVERDSTAETPENQALPGDTGGNPETDYAVDLAVDLAMDHAVQIRASLREDAECDSSSSLQAQPTTDSNLTADPDPEPSSYTRSSDELPADLTPRADKSASNGGICGEPDFGDGPTPLATPALSSEPERATDANRKPRADSPRADGGSKRNREWRRAAAAGFAEVWAVWGPDAGSRGLAEAAYLHLLDLGRAHDTILAACKACVKESAEDDLSMLPVYRFLAEGGEWESFAEPEAA